MTRTIICWRIILLLTLVAMGSCLRCPGEDRVWRQNHLLLGTFLDSFLVECSGTIPITCLERHYQRWCHEHGFMMADLRRELFMFGWDWNSDDHNQIQACWRDPAVQC